MKQLFSKGIVYSKIPRSGLGNCLLVWAHACVFADINGLDHIVGRWGKIRLGPILRHEKKNRLYWGYFREPSVFRLLWLNCGFVFRRMVYNPPVSRINTVGKMFVFTKGAPDADLFKRLVPYQKLIHQNLLSLLTPALLRKYKTLQAPEIAIHVRRGDFKMGNPVTPNSFFIEAITQLRRITGQNLSVTIFTDDNDDNVSDILAMGNARVANNKEDILDILQMSMSKFLVLSRSSSFSYWSAFLSDAFVIMSDDDWQKEIKPNSGNYFEFRWSGNHLESKEKLIDQLKVIQ